MADTYDRYGWNPTDIAITPGGEAADRKDARTRVREALGEAAHAMSDEDIDRVIAASTQTA